MKTLKKALVAGLALVVMFAMGASSLSAEETSVTGNWTLSAEGYTMGMVLAQKGTTITGTLESPHGLVPVKGEFVNGKITFSGSANDVHPLELSATGTLQADGTLAGDLTTNVGNMTWTAVRAKDK